jgi:cell division protein FtsI (penicillin-binding protein 3)
VFHNVMEGALRLMDVPPDHVEQWYATRPAPASAGLAATPVTATATSAVAAPALAAPAEDDGVGL